jgi:mandelate racemase
MKTTMDLTLKALRARAVNVLMPRPHATSSGTITSSPLVLLDLETEEGVTGRSYVFCYTPLALAPVRQLIANLEAVVKGDPVAPLALEEKLSKRFRLLGRPGVVGMAMAALDMAAWDAQAKARGVPLLKLLGGVPRPIPAYGAVGMSGVEGALSESAELAEKGFTAAKAKIGYADVATDVEVVRAMRRMLGDGATLMVDYNQSLSVPEAQRRLRILDAEGLAWVEEPTLADDYSGHARIAATAATPIQVGENWWGPHEMAKSVAAGGSDLVMPDVMKIGGVSAWQRAAALAEANGLPMSNHLFPEISTQLLCCTPTAHWLEYCDWFDPILAEPMPVKDGYAQPASAPGTGVAWNEAAIERMLA